MEAEEWAALMEEVNADMVSMQPLMVKRGALGGFLLGPAPKGKAGKVRYEHTLTLKSSNSSPFAVRTRVVTTPPLPACYVGSMLDAAIECHGVAMHLGDKVLN